MAAYIDWVRRFCLSLPHTTEKVRWEHNLLFCIGDKMYCVANLEPGMGPGKISFKCSPEKFAELVEVDGIIPAPYSARLFWVAMTEADALRQTETQALIKEAYEIVRGNLPKKLQAALAENARPAKAAVTKKAKRSAIKAKSSKQETSRRIPLKQKTSKTTAVKSHLKKKSATKKRVRS